MLDLSPILGTLRPVLTGSSPLHLGVTGTRDGSNDAQMKSLGQVVYEIADEMPSLVMHHGCCTGADNVAHCWAFWGGAHITGHPGCDRLGRSPHRMAGLWMKDLDECHQPALYSVRNKRIAQSCHLLIAAPAYPEDDPRSRRSGTWQTVRMARRLGREIAYVWPDGSVEARGIAVTPLALAREGGTDG